MLKSFRILFRLSLLCAHVTTGALFALILFSKPIKSLGLFNTNTLIRWWLNTARYFTGCRISSDKGIIESPSLIVSNHVSWLDILVLGGSYSLHFLSKEEVKKWPIIGFLTVVSGTLLIKRGAGSQGAIEEIHHALTQGDNVGLFPEGTTGSGLQTKPFHSRLLKAAYLANSSISVLSISYSTNGVSRDKKMGWEKQSIFEHLMYVLGQKTSYVKVNVITQLSNYSSMPRKELATHCQQLIDDDLKRNHYPSKQ